jgi:Na+-driven multidrug efflux pump
MRIGLTLGFNLAFAWGLSLIGLWIAQGIDESFKLVLVARRFRARLRELM